MTLVLIVVATLAIVAGAVLLLSTRAKRSRRPTNAQPTSSTPLVRPSLHSRQCPRCGRHAVEARADQFACGWCRHEWQVRADAPWPDVNLCLWIPADAGAVPPREKER